MRAKQRPGIVLVHPAMARQLARELHAEPDLDLYLQAREEFAFPGGVLYSMYLAELPIQVTEAAPAPDAVLVGFVRGYGTPGLAQEKFFVPPENFPDPEGWDVLRSEGNSPDEVLRILDH